MNFCTLLDILKSIKHKFICFSSTPIPTPCSAPLQNRRLLGYLRTNNPGFAAEVSSSLSTQEGSAGCSCSSSALPSTKGKCHHSVSGTMGPGTHFPHTHVPGMFCPENVCARGDAALPCQRPQGRLPRRRVNKADCQDNPFPCGVCGFISIFCEMR